MKNKGQSTLEYFLLLAAVVAVLVLLTSTNGSLFQSRLTNTVDTMTSSMQSMAGKFTNITP